MVQLIEQRSPSPDPQIGLPRRSDRSHRVLVRIELATGASALLCGGLLALRPDGSLLRLPTSVLDGGPFADWRLPGIALSVLVGLGYLVAGALERRRCPHSRVLSVVAGLGLIVFESVAGAWLGFHPLQAVFMGVGVAVISLAVTSLAAVDTQHVTFSP